MVMSLADADAYLLANPGARSFKDYYLPAGMRAVMSPELVESIFEYHLWPGT